MKIVTKILSIFLAVIMIVSIIPITSIEASAANGIQAKIDLIRTVYDTGSYFTSDGKSHNMWDYSVCPEDPNNKPMPYKTCKCSLSQQTKKTTGLYSGAEVASKLGVSRWQCAAFATYVFYNIFNKDYGTCGTVSIDNAKLGDVVVFDFDKSSYSEDHYAIYLYTSGSNIYVYDANSDYKSKVVYGSAYAKSSVVKVFRASNYDSVNNSTTPTPSVNLVTGLAGQYYLKGKSTGAWLSVSEGKDASTQPINTWGNWGQQFRVKLVAVGNGYKINFPLTSSLLVNPYSDTPSVGTKINLYKDVNDTTQQWGFEKVGDTYVIRSLYNTSLVLTDNGVNQATLTTYTGAANQLWYLYPYTTTVTYNANGGSGAPSSQTKYFKENLTLSSTKPTRSGYTFLGWSTSSSATSATYSAGGSFTTDGNTTLYAVWKANTLDVYFNANGASTSLDSLMLSDGIVCNISDGSKLVQTWTYNKPKANGLMNHNNTMGLYKTGYSFVGWGTTPDGGTIFSQSDNTLLPTDINPNVASNNCSTTLYAIWKANTYTISYNANGGTGAPSSQTKTHGSTLYLSSTIPTRSGYTFLGWSTSSSATSATYSAGGSFTSNANTTLYAVWRQDTQVLSVNTSNTATITNAGDSKYYTFTPSISGTYVIYSTSESDTQVYLYDSSGAQLASDDDSGESNNFRLQYYMTAGNTYRFEVKYWSSSNSGTIPFKIGNVYTISYNANGGTGAPSSQSKDYGTETYLSDTIPTRSGYTFLGWSTNSTATTAAYSAGGNFTTNANTTLYAVWRDDTYTISYNANGGTGAPSSQTKTHGVALTLSSTKPTRPGYTFLGWSTNSTATTAAYSAGGNFTTDSNTTLYAIWKLNTYTISYNANGGTGAPSSQTKTHGVALTLSSTKPTRTGYTFLGWSTSSSATSATYSAGGSFTSNANTTLYAVWKENAPVVANRWVKDANGWRYYDANGVVATNKWLKDSVGWCYVGADGYCVTNTWKKDSKGWCYLDANGRMATNKWIKDSQGWCYVGANGYCVTNTWKKDSKGWCYLDANGRMATNKWVKDSKGWCYVGADGYAVTNCWKKDSKGWCYLDENGSMTKNEWVNDGGKWYYLDSNGYMVTGTKVINGTTHTFNSKGILIS